MRTLTQLIFTAVLLPLFWCGAHAAADSSLYVVHTDRWSDEDELGYHRFIQSIGESDCASLNECLHSKDNPFFGSDPPSRRFFSDCAQLPYILRFYYAWKRGLPFSYVDAVTSRGGAGDQRYSQNGNRAISRKDVPSGQQTGMQIIEQIRANVSSATYRIHPDLDGPVTPDFYSPAIQPGSIKPGTIVYDPAGHVAIVFRVDPDGQVHSFDAHTDFTLTQITFDVRFARSKPAQGSGFKNWRPLKLVNGAIKPAKNSEIADFSAEQFYGTGPRPKESDWASGGFAVNGERLDFYDFVRARLGGGKLVFDPVKEVSEMTTSLCTDLQYRAGAVDLAKPMAKRAHPTRLPTNIYGTDGDWEMFSTPSRDARLKTAFQHLRDMTARFIALDMRGDNSHLSYHGKDLPRDLLTAYRHVSTSCSLSYTKSDGSRLGLSFEAARQRLFLMSFDPYHCPERRWGAAGAELASCPDGAAKAAWYDAEQTLRNQTERTYDARMDYTLEDLSHPSIGVASPPDTDVEGYLVSVQKRAERE